MNKVLSTIVLTAIFLMVAACQDSRVENAFSIIDVNEYSSSESREKIEKISLSGCDGEGSELQNLASLTTVNRTIKTSPLATSSHGKTIEVPESIKLQIDKEVENYYQPLYNKEISRLEDIFIKDYMGAQMTYHLRWVKNKYTARILYSYENDVYETTSEYELSIPHLLFQTKVSCPHLNYAAINTPPAIATPSENNIATLITQSLLYKGPSMAYEFVEPKKRSKGEVFFVLSRHNYKTAIWFFVETMDKEQQGWLKSSWLDYAFDLETIPLATNIPPIPTQTPTKKAPSEEATPTPFPSYP